MKIHGYGGKPLVLLDYPYVNLSPTGLQCYSQVTDSFGLIPTLNVHFPTTISLLCGNEIVLETCSYPRMTAY